MRIYDTKSYRRVRRYLRALHLAGELICVRCGNPIDPFEPMDVGHVDGDPTTIAGPEHRHSRHCSAGGNRATSRHRFEREHGRRLSSRVW